MGSTTFFTNNKRSPINDDLTHSIMKRWSNSLIYILNSILIRMYGVWCIWIRCCSQKIFCDSKHKMECDITKPPNAICLWQTDVNKDVQLTPILNLYSALYRLNSYHSLRLLTREMNVQMGLPSWFSLLHGRLPGNCRVTEREREREREREGERERFT